MESLVEQLSRAKLARYRFEIEAAEKLELPSYKGSTFRGAFGHAFKRVICALRNKECEGCLLKDKCVYSYVFFTPLPPGTERMRKYPYAPHPFVLEPPLERDRFYEKGEKLYFELVLIGKGIEYLPYFIYAFDELGQSGIGRKNGQFLLKAVYEVGVSDTSVRIYDSGAKTLADHDGRWSLDEITSDVAVDGVLGVTFLTPTRVKEGGEFASDVSFQLLVRSLLRRVSSLLYFHCNVDLNLDFKEMIERAGSVETRQNRLNWHDWERYSNRQKTRMKMGGVLGSVQYEGDMTEFSPLIKLGEQVHVGKGTSFGLGKYMIEEGK